MPRKSRFCCGITFLALAGAASGAEPFSLPAALENAPGGVLQVPPGEHRIDKALVIRRHRTVLTGFATIIQVNTNEPIIRVDNAAGVILRDLTLTRPADAMEAAEPAVRADRSPGLSLENLRVEENHSPSGAIDLHDCDQAVIRHCLIRNYKRISVDDRTQSPLYGYAFRCIDGLGIVVRGGLGTFIEGNRIIEERLLPTEENHGRFGLGQLVPGARPTEFGELGREVKRTSYARNWHQGSGIMVSISHQSPTEFTRITGNYIESAAQGIDLHTDRVICRDNLIRFGMIGIKVMHGSEHVIVSDNIIHRLDLWGIFLGPGSLSHLGGPEKPGGSNRPPNVDGGTILSHNVISEFGYGHEWWNWGGRQKELGSGFPIRIDAGQLPANPPVRDVLIAGNLVLDPTRGAGVGAEAGREPEPRYRYAVYVERRVPGERNDFSSAVRLHFRDNILHDGRKGVANVPLEP